MMCPLVNWTSDSLGYMRLVREAILGGYLPEFGFLPIGYPLFCGVLQCFSDSIYVIVICQHLITLLLGVFLIYGIHRYYTAHALSVSLALGILMLSSFSPFYDSYIMTESLYVNSLLFLFVAFFYAIHTGTYFYWSLLSVALVLPPLIRPIGIFTLVIYGVLLACLLYRERSRTVKLSFAVPFLFLLGSYCMYNYFTMGIFTFTTSERVGRELNEAEIPKRYTGEKRKAMFPGPSFGKAFTHYRWISDYARYERNLKEMHNKFFVWNWPANLQYVHPDSLHKMSERIIYRFEQEGKDPEPIKKLVFKEFYYPEKIAHLEGKYQKLIVSPIYKLYDLYEIHVHEPLFRNVLWIFLFLFSVILSVSILVKTKFADKPALLILALTLINFGHNFIHILVNHRTLPRYEYPTEFTYYLSAAFLPLLIISSLNKKKQKNSLVHAGASKS